MEDGFADDRGGDCDDAFRQGSADDDEIEVDGVNGRVGEDDDDEVH